MGIERTHSFYNAYTIITIDKAYFIECCSINFVSSRSQHGERTVRQSLLCMHLVTQIIMIKGAFNKESSKGDKAGEF